MFFNTSLKELAHLFFPPKPATILLITRHVSCAFSKWRTKELGGKGIQWCIRCPAENRRCFSVLKLTWILICSPHLQHGHRLLSCAATGWEGERQSYTFSSNNQRQRNVLIWTEPPKPQDSGPGNGHWVLAQAAPPVLHQTLLMFSQSLDCSIRTGALLVLNVPAALSSLWKARPSSGSKSWDMKAPWAGAMQQQTKECLYFNICLIDLYPAGTEKSFRKHNIQFPFHLRDASQA